MYETLTTEISGNPEFDAFIANLPPSVAFDLLNPITERGVEHLPDIYGWAGVEPETVDPRG